MLIQECKNCGGRMIKYNIIERFITKPHRLLLADNKIKAICYDCEAILRKW